MKNILALCLSPDKGGLELYFLKLVEYYKIQGLAISVASLENSHITKNISDNLITCPSRGLFKRFRSFLRIRNFMIKKSLDVIHVSWGKDLLLAVMLKIFTPANIKIIYYRQMKITRPKKDIFHKFIYKNISKILVITEKLREEAIKYLPLNEDKIIKLTYGIKKPDNDSIIKRKNFFKENNMNPNNFTIGIFSRIEEQKGQHLVIQAISEIDYDIQVFIIGHCMNQTYKRKLLSISSDKGLNNSIIFLDFVESPMTIMPCFDLIILPTYEETFGLIVAESMLMGVPVIGSNAGGVPEIIKNEINGLLFQTKNYQSLRDKIKLLIEDDQMRNRIKDEGIKYSNSQYDYNSHFKKLQSIFDNL